MIITDIHQFAIAVVQSSSPDLSVEEKINLYNEAVEKAEKNNSEIPPGEDKSKNWLY